MVPQRRHFHVGILNLFLVLWLGPNLGTAKTFPSLARDEALKGIFLPRSGRLLVRSGATFPQFEPPSFSKLLEDQKVQEGQEIILQARLSSVLDPDISVRWYRDGKLLHSDSRHQITFDLTIALLEIKSSKISDSGNYTCVAVNRWGRDKTTCTVSVKEGDKGINEPEHQFLNDRSPQRGRKLWRSNQHQKSSRSYLRSHAPLDDVTDNAITEVEEVIQEDSEFEDLNLNEGEIVPELSVLSSIIDGVDTDEPIFLEGSDSEVTPGLFQGDIAGFNPELYVRIGINWHVLPEKKWKGGIVPYHISSKYLFQERILLERAIASINFFTCVKFVPYNRKHKDYILIWPVEQRKGCWSFVGRRGGQQLLSIQQPDSKGTRCMGSIGKPIHELLHALGIFHEQSRPDRDKYVKIDVNNIISKYKNNFKIKKKGEVTYDFPYDFNSLMHYGNRFFSKNRRKPTIIPKVKGAKIGQRNMMSRLDCLKINSLYGCLDKEPFEANKYRAFCDTLAY